MIPSSLSAVLSPRLSSLFSVSYSSSLILPKLWSSFTHHLSFVSFLSLSFSSILSHLFRPCLPCSSLLISSRFYLPLCCLFFIQFDILSIPVWYVLQICLTYLGTVRMVCQQKVGYYIPIKNKLKNSTRNTKAFSNTTLACNGGQILWVLSVPNISTPCHLNSQPVRVREPPPPCTLFVSHCNTTLFSSPADKPHSPRAPATPPRTSCSVLARASSR